MFWWVNFLLLAVALPQNGKQYPPGHLEQLTIYPDEQIHSFWFGKTGTIAFQSFLIHPQVGIQLFIFDCFCSGDAFRLLNHGSQINSGYEYVNTGGDTCQIYDSAPFYCFNSYQQWSQYVYYLPPAQYNLTILVTDSPYQYGQAFLLARWK